MSPADHNSVQIDATASVPKKRRRPIRAGVIVSLVFHTTAVVAMIVVPYLIWLWMLSQSLVTEQQVTIIAVVEEEQPDEPEAKPVKVVTEVNQVTAVPVQEKIQQYVEQSNLRPDEEDRDEFEKHARRLEKISDEAAVEAMAVQFREWLGTKERASEPSAEPVAGKFDDDTAQFHDIRRVQEDDGTWRYFAVLVDAEGRSIETELFGPDAEANYQNLQRVKQFPLADQVRRQILMPLLEKIAPDNRPGRPQPRAQ